MGFELGFKKKTISWEMGLGPPLHDPLRKVLNRATSLLKIHQDAKGAGARVGAFRIVNSEGLSEKQLDILEEIKVAIEEGRGEELRPLKHVDRTRLRESTQEINVLLTHIETTDITETNHNNHNFAFHFCSWMM